MKFVRNVVMALVFTLGVFGCSNELEDNKEVIKKLSETVLMDAILNMSFDKLDEGTKLTLGLAVASGKMTKEEVREKMKEELSTHIQAKCTDVVNFQEISKNKYNGKALFDVVLDGTKDKCVVPIVVEFLGDQVTVEIKDISAIKGL